MRERMKEEVFGLVWPGKKEALEEAFTFCSKKLVLEEDNASENMFIEGDNIDALKLLQGEYASKVKMIYIDPPYNTGKKFNYNDNFSYSKKEWLQFYPNTSLYGRFHTKWLNMMYPRLYLARNLLREDGVIFISIDDHEVANLRKLCDEIFGEENFIAQIIWKKRSGPPNDKKLGTVHEYIMVFSKDINTVFLRLKERTQEQLARYKNPDGHTKGKWVAGDLMANIKGGRYVKSLYFPIINSKTGEEHYPSSGGNWRFNKEKIQRLIENNEIYFGEDGKGRPKLKRFLSDVKEGTAFSSWFDYVGYSNTATEEISKIFGNVNLFDTPKPTALVKEILKISTCDDNIILDFFAGSATTAHAVFDLNQQDGGNRKFILVQLPEPCAPESEAYKSGYKTIADIGEERIRRVIKKLEIKEGFNTFTIKEREE